MMSYFLTGLTLDLFINQMEYIPSLSQEAGVRVLLTTQRNIPFPVDEGFTVSPGFSTSIGLRQVCLLANLRRVCDLRLSFRKSVIHLWKSVDANFG